MKRFGVCNYDFNAYKPKVENLVQFDEYDEAFNYYFQQLTKYEGYPYFISCAHNHWIVWIENNLIVQFEQISLNTKCKLVDISNVSN